MFLQAWVHAIPLDLRQLCRTRRHHQTDSAGRHVSSGPGPEGAVSGEELGNAFAAGCSGNSWCRTFLVSWECTRRETPRVWLDDEVSFLESIARQIAVGYQYTRLYTDKEREAETKRALLEIANALNARSDFREVSSLVLERAITLVGADYSALGVLDPKGGRITLAAFKAAPHAATDTRAGLDR